MDKHPSVLIVGFLLILILSGLISIACAQNGLTVAIELFGKVRQVPIFILCAVVVFVINWFAYIPAIIKKTEHFYDLVGSLTYISVIVIAIILSASFDWRSIVVALMVVVWASRLGMFLFVRVKKAGADDRFDEVKVDPLKFLLAWTLQAMWVLLTSACAVVVITSQNYKPIDLISVLGIVLWLAGFLLEVIADYQKKQFRLNVENKDKFIQSGLWAWSQHPNYLGEIILWSGMSLIAIPVLQGWQWLALISPFFVYLLLTKGSGIPTLDEKSQSKWGNDPEYKKYITNTGLLFPKIK